MNLALIFFKFFDGLVRVDLNAIEGSFLIGSDHHALVPDNGSKYALPRVSVFEDNFI
jgi:hypothetical protein